MFELGAAGGIVRCHEWVIGGAEAFSLCDRYSREVGFLFGIKYGLWEGGAGRSGTVICFG